MEKSALIAELEKLTGKSFEALQAEAAEWAASATEISPGVWGVQS